MKELLSLLKSDLARVSFWFEKQTISKILVFLGLVFLFIGLSVSLYFLSKIFFLSVAFLGQFGRLTAVYIFHASIIMLLWFTIVITIISSLTLLLNSNSEIDSLLVLPLNQKIIQSWIFLKTAIINFFFLFIILTPIIIAFAQIFLNGINLILILKYGITLVFIVSLINSLGSLAGFSLAYFVKGRGVFAANAGVLVFFAITLLIFRFIFPPRLSFLYSAPAEEFMNIYNSLPINNQFLPTYWLSSLILTDNFFYLLLLIILCSLLVFFSLKLQSAKFISLYHFQKEHKMDSYPLSPSVFSKKLASSSRPLLLKDWLSIIRTPSEIGYGLFLTLLGLIFFFLLSLSCQRFPIYTNMEKFLILFSFAWFQFFTMAYLLRLVFPLMAREGPYSWYLFALPLRPGKILLEKILLGLCLSSPYLFFSILLWKIIPFTNYNILIIMIVSFVSVIVLSLLVGLLGTLWPNFSEGDNPEKISTSSMGITTLFSSIAIIGFDAYILINLLEGVFTVSLGLILFFSFNLLLLAFLSFLTCRQEKTYQF